MSVNWESIRKEWETTSITLIDLAEKHGVKEGTLKSRKSREKWQKVATKKDASKNKKMQPSKKVATSNRPKQNRGNPNPKNQFTERNQAALKHGLFSRYIPKETMEIMGLVANGDEESILWMQIQIQFAAIIRAQEIMHVADKDELVKVLKREKQVGGKTPGFEEEYEIQFAWDRFERFLKAQTRAIGELRASIKQYLELPFIDEMKRAQISLISEQITKLAKENKPNTSTEDKLHEYFKALQGAFKDDDTTETKS